MSDTLSDIDELSQFIHKHSWCVLAIANVSYPHENIKKSIQTAQKRRIIYLSDQTKVSVYVSANNGNLPFRIISFLADKDKGCDFIKG